MRVAGCSVCSMVVFVLGVGDVGAQTRPAAAADVTLSSRYDWRGITRHNGWVLQGDLVGGVRFGSGFVTVGGWTNYELRLAEPASTDVGLGKHFGEWNVWAEVALWRGPFDVSVGHIRYFVDEDAAAAVGTTVFNTGETYVDAQVRIGPFTPRAAVSLDLEKVKGAYIEIEAAYRIPVLPLAVPSLYVSVLGGFSAGQAIDTTDPSQGGYFATNGLTHIDFSARTQVYLPIGPLKDLYATPEVHFVVNIDEATKRTSRSPEDADKATKWRFAVALSWYW